MSETFKEWFGRLNNTSANCFTIRDWTEGLRDSSRIKIIELFRCIEKNRNDIRQRLSYQIEVNSGQQKRINELEAQLKLKTQNEIDASVNADCLAGCRVKLTRVEAQLAGAVEALTIAEGFIDDSHLSSLYNKCVKKSLEEKENNQ